MALQTIPGFIPIPRHYAHLPTGLSNMLIDAADEEAAAVFYVGKTGTISKVGFLTGTVTTGATVKAALKTVDLANGDPTGTLLAVGSEVSVVIADADDDKWFLETLDTAVAVTKGDLIAMSIINPSASFGNINIRNLRFDRTDFPYQDLFTGTWTKGDRKPCFALEYSDGSYAVQLGLWPVTSTPTPTFNNGTTPDERGLKFRLPFPVRVTGVWSRGGRIMEIWILFYMILMIPYWRLFLWIKMF